MRLWTIQEYAAYQQLIEKGILTADENKIGMLEHFRFAYDWMSRQMEKRVGAPPEGVKYPIWAWYQWNGMLQKKPDMRYSGHSERGEHIVRITLEVDEKEVLLSDFDLWHIPLNWGYLSLNENEDTEFQNKYETLGYTYHQLQDFSINAPAMTELRAEMTKSWERIFDLILEPNEWIVEPIHKKSIQATLWSIRPEQFVKAEEFIAR